jgi:hypothetical protein
VNHPFESRVGPGCSALNIASRRRGDVSFDVEVRKERCVKFGTRGTAPAEGHRVWTVQALAEIFGFNVSGVLYRVSSCYSILVEPQYVTYHVPVEASVRADIVGVDITGHISLDQVTMTEKLTVGKARQRTSRIDSGSCRRGVRFQRHLCVL